MKTFINFVLRNITILNSVSILFTIIVWSILIINYNLVTLTQDINPFFLLINISLGLFGLILDFLVQKFIKNRLYVNLIGLIIIILFIIFFIAL